MLGGLGGKANRGIYTEVILEIEWTIRNFCCGVWEWHEIRCASLEVPTAARTMGPELQLARNLSDIWNFSIAS
jgi:hypothetical protein